jgi:predicted TIM-barrel fold metal-dependent hydrolase
MIASGLFDRHPGLKIVIRSGGGGLPLLLHRLFWKHKGPKGEQRYSDILLEHFLIDTAGVNARTLQFLIDTLGEERIVFGSDYCGGLGPLEKALPVIEEQRNPTLVKTFTERNSRNLLHL